MRLFAVLALILTSVAVPAIARDDGGFGAGFTGSAPSALPSAKPASIAAAERDQVNPSSVADIEPAAGDETDAAQDSGKTVQNHGQATGKSGILQPSWIVQPDGTRVRQ